MPTERGAAPSRTPWAGIAIVCAGVLPAPLDTSVNVAFPVITDAFALPLREIQWVVIAFVLAQSSLTIVFGRLGDLHGHRRIFRAGMIACALAHLAAALAPTFGWLLAARVLQGAAVGLAMSCGPALVSLMVPPEQKRRALGVFVTATSLGMAIGPLAGGVLIHWLGWPGVFWFRVPLALLVLCLLPLVPGPWRPPADADADADADAASRPSAPHAAPHPPTGFDTWGAVLLTVSLGCLVLLLTQATRPDAGALLAISLAAATALSVSAFVRHASRHPAPVLRTAPFRSARFSAVQAGSVVINFACFSIMLLIPYVLSATPGTSISAAGVLLAFYPVGLVLGGLCASRLGHRVTSTGLMHAGTLLAAIGLATIAAVVARDGLAPLVAALLLTGLGHGAFQVGCMDVTTTLLPPEERGVAGSLVSVTRLLGIVLGATGIGWLHAATARFDLTFSVLGGGLFLYAVVGILTRRRSS